MPPVERSAPADALTLLAQGEIEVKGRMPWSSNHTFLVEVSFDGTTSLGVYKPGRGERPLWDFPDGLYHREVAAYLLAEALGWPAVPETVIRDGPLGPGSVQRFVPADFDQHYFTLLERREHHDQLRAICAFDVIANNADRKGGHCLLGEDGRIWAVDHGLCFHDQPKLRTVIWDFAREPLPEQLTAAMARVAAAPPPALADVLDDREIDALSRRAAAFLRHGRFPDPGGSRPYPWPLV